MSLCLCVRQRKIGMKRLCVTIVILAVLMLMLAFWWHRKQPTEVAEIVVCQEKEQTRGGQPLPIAKPDMPGREKGSTANVFKLQSLQVGAGGATVLEIDHGLPEQRVDTKETGYVPLFDRALITEPLTQDQLDTANAWKVAYLNRLRAEKWDESYINAYLQAWNLSEEYVFGKEKK